MLGVSSRKFPVRDDRISVSCRGGLGVENHALQLMRVTQNISTAYTERQPSAHRGVDTPPSRHYFLKQENRTTGALHMRVICENCGATYKIPESKLVKEVNKATCRKCGFKMMIRRPSAAVVAGVPPPADADSAATQVAGNPFDHQSEERGLLEANTRVQAAIQEWSDEAPTQVQVDPTGPPEPGPPAPRQASSSAPKPNPVIIQSGKAPGDMLLALVATFASAGGAMLLATNIAGSPGQRVVGLGIALWGAFTCLFLLVTGSLWRQKGNVPISIALATVLGLGGSAFVEVALHGSAGLDLVSIPSIPELSKDAEELPAVPTTDDAEAVDALTGDAEIEEPVDLSDPEPDAAPTEAEGSAPDAVADRAPTPRAPSTGRGAPPPPDEDFDDVEELEDPDFDDVAVARSSQDQAEENRRAEMESAAQARAAQREREAREEESRRAREENAARAAAERAAAAKAAAATRAASSSRSNSSGGSKMKSLPLTVVDTMVRSNMSIKRCFFNEKQSSGAMPRRVNVRFTVLNTGRVSSARVTTDQYKGGTLDSCLGRAFKAIQFPPFQGEAKSMTYPFVL